MTIIEATKENFESEVLKSKSKVLVDFNADWCGPCQMLRPVIEEIAKTREDVKIVSVNIDDEAELAEEYGIMSIPCLVLFNEGEEVKRSVGLIPKDEIENMIGAK